MTFGPNAAKREFRCGLQISLAALLTAAVGTHIRVQTKRTWRISRKGKRRHTKGCFRSFLTARPCFRFSYLPPHVEFEAITGFWSMTIFP